MFDFEEALKLVAQQSVLCIGDLMLDDFVYGEVERISPEAPTPVLAVRHSEIGIGGAGNVARNIAALGARCIFVALIGNDEAGLILTNALGKQSGGGGIVPDLVIDRTRQTTRKVRFVSEHHSTHLMRADWETAAPASAQSEAELIAYSQAALPQVGAVVLSDYAKGVLTPRARQAGRGRPEGARLRALSRRQPDHAEPPRACRRGASSGHQRNGNCRGRRRARAKSRL
jgi:D-beta-D-heptose 7-phosphate kinase/D-beta-D-heptose 1-phosphate adenosyltransferase